MPAGRQGCYEPDPMGTRRNFWAVVETKFGEETLAAREIRNQGFEVFTPLYQEKLRGGVRKVCHLFPGYIFVHIRVSHEGRWRSINGTRGVKRLMTWGEQPARVLTRDIEFIRSLENGKGYIHIDNNEPPVFGFGQNVVPLAGLFEGQRGEHRGPVRPGRLDRVKVLFEMFGRVIESEQLASDLVPA